MKKILMNDKKQFLLSNVTGLLFLTAILFPNYFHWNFEKLNFLGWLTNVILLLLPILAVAELFFYIWPVKKKKTRSSDWFLALF